MRGAGPVIETRLKHLEAHLEQENPVLLTTVQSFRELDAIAYRMGLFNPEQSYATQIPWWPLISVLGTFSAGKSTFINHYLGMKLQRSGNQAVDDKFTVMCFSNQSTTHALPGQALDSDPRFPFYKISTEIEKVAKGEGSRIDAYLQLKTSASKALRGKILIDSPGFDADAQRTSTLRITDHIIDLSDLVLVFFDARHPEPGAMRDTLDHLVSKTIARQDSGKFLYILNQLDTTAREDNPEEVVAAWQRALGERGLTAGRFYTIYNQEAANPIPDEALRRRFESKRDNDLNEIHERMEQVEIERAYRIVGSLEKVARAFEAKTVPALQGILDRWRRRTLIGDVIAAGLLIALFLGVTNQLGQWDGMQLKAAWWDYISATPMRLYFAALGAYVVWLLVHFGVRKLAATSLMSAAERVGQQLGIRGSLKEAFRINTRPWHSIFSRHPVGWSRRSRRHAQKVLEDADRYVQDLNDRFTNPSGNTPVEFTAAPLDEYDRDSIDAPAPARAGTAD
ncbi:MAG: dynamin family protein [Gammaproteobacteria bacterium]|nr:dynamin family protein [Gammaproteobacteria bacterium]MCP5298796.1 dynamin family protein [Chromatiaceae bacterium]